MAIAIMTELRGLTQETYDALRHELGQAGFADGAVVHVAGPMEGGWWTFDVWESQEAFEAFGAVLGPLLQKYELSATPKIYEVHNTM